MAPNIGVEWTIAVAVKIGSRPVPSQKQSRREMRILNLISPGNWHARSLLLQISPGPPVEPGLLFSLGSLSFSLVSPLTDNV